MLITSVSSSVLSWVCAFAHVCRTMPNCQRALYFSLAPTRRVRLLDPPRNNYPSDCLLAKSIQIHFEKRHANYLCFRQPFLTSQFFFSSFYFAVCCECPWAFSKPNTFTFYGLVITRFRFGTCQSLFTARDWASLEDTCKQWHRTFLLEGLKKI